MSELTTIVSGFAGKTCQLEVLFQEINLQAKEYLELEITQLRNQNGFNIFPQCHTGFMQQCAFWLSVEQSKVIGYQAGNTSLLHPGLWAQEFTSQHFAVG